MLNKKSYFLQTNKAIYHNILFQIAKEAIQKMMFFSNENKIFNTLCKLPSTCNVGYSSNTADVMSLFIKKIVSPEDEYLNTSDFINDIFKLGNVKQAKVKIPLIHKKRILQILLKYMNQENFYGMIIEINNDKIITISHPLRLFEYVYSNCLTTDIVTNIVIYYSNSEEENIPNENEELYNNLLIMCQEFQLIYKNNWTKGIRDDIDKKYKYIEFNINPKGIKVYTDFQFVIQNITENSIKILIPVDILNKNSYVPYYGILHINHISGEPHQIPITIKYAPTGNIAWRAAQTICCGSLSSKTVEGLLTLSHYNANSSYYLNGIHPQYMMYANTLLKVTKTFVTDFLKNFESNK